MNHPLARSSSSSNLPVMRRSGVKDLSFYRILSIHLFPKSIILDGMLSRGAISSNSEGFNCSRDIVPLIRELNQIIKDDEKRLTVLNPKTLNRGRRSYMHKAYAALHSLFQRQGGERFALYIMHPMFLLQLYFVSYTV